MPLIGEPWERVSIDETGPHPISSRGNKFILTLTDHFSKWVEPILLSNHKAAIIARALIYHVCSRCRVPAQILTDRGAEFQSDLNSRTVEVDGSG